MSIARIECLSDGVFAIVVTLLVLEFHIPALRVSGDSGELAAALKLLLPKFLSWVASFVYVCTFWVHHHDLLRKARSADPALIWLNNLLLLCQSFVPFPTALLGSYPDNALAVCFFGVVLVLNSLSIIAIHVHIAKRLLKEGYDKKQERASSRRNLIGPAIFATAAALAWVRPSVSMALYLLVPPLFILPSRSRFLNEA